eukprot:4121116-Amphidinium_carterae.1
MMLVAKYTSLWQRSFPSLPTLQAAGIQKLLVSVAVLAVIVQLQFSSSLCRILEHCFVHANSVGLGRRELCSVELIRKPVLEGPTLNKHNVLSPKTK